MTNPTGFFYGKCLSASLAALCFFVWPGPASAAITGTLTTSGQLDRKHWPAATKEAIGAFSEIQDESVWQVDHQRMANFTLTAYTLDLACTGKSPASPAFGITASGTHAKVGRTVAVDPVVIPIGTLLYIPSIGWRIAEDSGGAVKGRHIDILLPTRRDAIDFGIRHNVEIYLYARAAT